jgi:hypothetical protein
MAIRSRRIVRLAMNELYSLVLCPNGMFPGLGVKDLLDYSGADFGVNI